MSKPFIPNYSLSKMQILDRISDMKEELSKFNHEREGIDAHINRLKVTRSAVIRKFSKA